MSTKKAPASPKVRRLGLLGANIQEQCRRIGLTQQDLADAMGLGVAYISLIERGGRNPPIETVVTIAKAMGVPVARHVDDG